MFSRAIKYRDDTSQYLYILYILTTILEIFVSIFYIIGKNERNPVSPDDNEWPTSDSQNPRRIAGLNDGRRSRGEYITHT